MANIIGEPFKDYVDGQIKKRQEIHGKTNRSIKEISYLNSTNAWVKLASGVTLTQERIDLLKKSYGNSIANNVNPGKELAMQNVLFNGLTSMGGTSLAENPSPDQNAREFLNFMNSTDENGNETEKERFNQQQRTDFLGPNGAYGVGGYKFGIVPMPGIISVDSKDLNRGSIKRSQVKIKAYNKQQFDIIDVLYLRLGYTVLLEFGNNQYWDDKSDSLTQMGATLIDRYFFEKDDNYYDLLEKIELTRKQKRGNYDAILGKVVNFSWTFAPDGTYDIDLDIISVGDVIESLKMNLPPVGLLSNAYADRQVVKNQFRNKVALDVEDFYKIYPSLKNQLRGWWDSTINANPTDVPNVKYYLADDLVIGKTNFLYSILTDKEFDLNSSSVNNDFGVMTVYNFPRSIEPDVITAAQVNDNIKKAIKFALISSFTGVYGGKFYQGYNKNIGGRNFINDPFIYSKKSIKSGSGLGSNVVFQDIGGAIWNPDFKGKYTIKDKDGNIVKNSQNLFFDEGNAVAIEGAYISFNEVAFPGTSIFTDPNITGGPTISNIQSNFINAQRVLLHNTYGFEVFENLVFQWFVFNNLAGGAQDNQFKDNPEFASYSQELEYEKDKNRIYQWFYRIRKYYTGITKDTAEFFDIEPQEVGTKYGKVRVNGKNIGFVLNPYDVNTKKLDEGSTSPLTPSRAASLTNEFRKKILRDWNEKVNFPTYNQQSSNIDLIVLDKDEDNEFNLEDRYKYFVRLKTLLEFVQENIIPQIIPSKDTKTPLIKIDTDSNSNICYAIDNMISSDIRSCIVRNNEFYVGSNELDENSYIKLFDGEPGLEYFLERGVGGQYIYGRPMNVYLNFEFVQNTLDTIVGVDGEALLFDFLKKICNEINKCLGYVNNLEPVIDQEINTIKIIDQTPIPGIEEIVKGLQDDNGNIVYPNFNLGGSAMLEVFGYNNGTSNFVHNIGLTTSISKRYASMITIGATANGSIPGSESTAFSKWNSGVIDRIKPEIVDATSNTNDNQTLKAQNQNVRENYAKLISNPSEDYIFRLINLTSTGEIEPIYLENNGPTIENFYKYAQAKSSESGSLESSVGFLPFNLQIDMEGLSGMKIYNRINVDTRFLPSNYPQTLDFIITQVNHRLENNKWTTSLQTQATRVLKEKDEGNIINTPKLLGDEATISRAQQLKTLKDSEGFIRYDESAPESYFFDDDTVEGKPNYSTKGEKITTQTLLQRLHPDVRNKWRPFLLQLMQERGFKYSITSSFRSVKKAAQLKSQSGSKTARPGKSAHNVGIGLDIVVHDLVRNKRYGNKQSREEWLKLPIVGIAASLNMKWGGNFNGYNDPVHFTVWFNADKTLSNFENAFNFKATNKMTVRQAERIDSKVNKAGGGDGNPSKLSNEGPNYEANKVAIFRDVRIDLISDDVALLNTRYKFGIPFLNLLS